MSDLDIKELMAGILRRKYAEGQRTKVIDDPGILEAAGTRFWEPLDEGEIPVLAIYKLDSPTHVESILTTRRVATFVAGSRSLRYNEIIDWQSMPFPRTRSGELVRLKILGRNGSELYIQGEPGPSYHAILALIQNRVHAAKRIDGTDT